MSPDAIFLQTLKLTKIYITMIYMSRHFRESANLLRKTASYTQSLWRQSVPRSMKHVTQIPSKRSIGERVRSLRMQIGLTQLELAEQLDMSQSNLSEMERGMRGLTLQQLIKVSRLLKTSADWILFGGSANQSMKPKLSLKILRRVHRIQELPPAKQRAVLQILDAILEQQNRSNGAG